MITFLIFKIALIVALAFMVLNYILKLMYEADGLPNMLRRIYNFLNVVLPGTIRIALMFISLGVCVITVVFGSVIPYTQQQQDLMLIDEYTVNIELYKEYSNEYATAARKQISEYQKMQSEMARNATVAQLQFWSAQQDSIGNQLTDSIRAFQTLIMEQELAINKAQSRINRRPNNKWYFGI